MMERHHPTLRRMVSHALPPLLHFRLHTVRVMCMATFAVIALPILSGGALLQGRSPVPPDSEHMAAPSGVWIQIQHGGDRRGNYRWTFLDNGTVTREEILTVEGRAPITLTGNWAVEGGTLRVQMASLQFSFVLTGGALVSGEHRLEREDRAHAPGH